jgi:hypothetical protein
MRCCRGICAPAGCGEHGGFFVCEDGGARATRFPPSVTGCGAVCDLNPNQNSEPKPKLRAAEAASPQDAPPRFAPKDVFVGIICGWTRQKRSLVANGFGY